MIDNSDLNELLKQATKMPYKIKPSLFQKIKNKIICLIRGHDRKYLSYDYCDKADVFSFIAVRPFVCDRCGYFYKGMHRNKTPMPKVKPPKKAEDVKKYVVETGYTGDNKQDTKIIKTPGPEYVDGQLVGHCYDGSGWFKCSFWKYDKKTKISKCMMFGKHGIMKWNSKALEICDNTYGVDYDGPPLKQGINNNGH